MACFRSERARKHCRLRRAEKTSTGKSGAGAVSGFRLSVGFANFAIALRAKFLKAKHAKDSQRAQRIKPSLEVSWSCFRRYGLGSERIPPAVVFENKRLSGNSLQVFEE